MVRCGGLDQLRFRLILKIEVELVLLEVQLKVVLKRNTEKQADVVAPVTRPKENLRWRILLLPCIFGPAQLCCDSVVRGLVVRLQVRRPKLCRVI